MRVDPPPYRIAIQSDDFDVAIETQHLTTDRHDIGAVCTFTGLCRSESQSLIALELEHYPGMAEAEIERVVQVASTRWPLMGIRVIHRFGKIAPGGNINYKTGHAVFEATHGTAPKYANLDKVNPGSVILSGEMMLRYMGWNEAADALIAAMDKAIGDKKVTYDFARLMDGATEVKCSEFADRKSVV